MAPDKHYAIEKSSRGLSGLPVPDGRFTNDEQIAEGDRVVQCWSFKGTHKGEFFGVPGTGKLVAFTGTTRLRIADGKVAEHWGHWDVIGWLKQVGKPLL